MVRERETGATAAPATGADRLGRFQADIEAALLQARTLADLRGRDATITDFDIRGDLYRLAHDMAPEARNEEVEAIRRWLEPKAGETGLEIAAGTGFLTRHVHRWTGAPVYAVDPSQAQLRVLQANVPAARAVCCSGDDRGLGGRLPRRQIDFAVSLGGIHHVEDQERLFANVADALRPGGRFVLGDVCADTALARHFDDVVAAKCLTGHTARWLDRTRVAELARVAGLTVARVEVLPLHMDFGSEKEMSLFFKGLHAYDLPESEVASDLGEALGVERRDGLCRLKWPLLLAALERP